MAQASTRTTSLTYKLNISYSRAEEDASAIPRMTHHHPSPHPPLHHPDAQATAQTMRGTEAAESQVSIVDVRFGLNTGALLGFQRQRFALLGKLEAARHLLQAVKAKAAAADSKKGKGNSDCVGSMGKHIKILYITYHCCFCGW